MAEKNNEDLEESKKDEQKKDLFEEETVSTTGLDMETEESIWKEESEEEPLETVKQNDDFGEKSIQEDTSKHKNQGTYILGGAIALALVLGILWKGGLFSGMNGEKDMPVAYAKENTLYMYDLKNEPYQVADSLSDGGKYSYYYAAWGAGCTEDAKTLYYTTKVKPSGAFQLYRRGIQPDAKGQLIAEDVVDYQINQDGTVCAYLKENDKGEKSLYVYDHNKESLVSESVPLIPDAYFLSKDGRYIVYQKQTDNQITNLYAMPIQSREEQLVCKSLQMISYAKEENKVYFVSEKEGTYSVYEFMFGKEPSLIAEKATFMELLPNGKDLLYCTQSEAKIELKEIIEDDIPEKENEIRSLLQEKEWDSPMQNCYIWSGGNSLEVASDILNASVVQDESGYVLYSTIDTSSIEKIKLSEVESEEDARYKYFGSLMMAPRLTYLVEPGNTAAAVEKTNVRSESFLVAPTQDRVVFQEVDVQTGNETFITASLNREGTLSEYKKLSGDVQFPSFGGKGNTLYYLTGYAGMGSLNVMVNGEEKLISDNVTDFKVADDADRMYFISEASQQTGNGILKVYENGTVSEIDKDVFCIQYKGNGKLVYMKQYDIASEKGDLYYWNGKESKKIDEGISSIFIY